jgi:hypothetical protein
MLLYLKCILDKIENNKKFRKKVILQKLDLSCDLCKKIKFGAKIMLFTRHFLSSYVDHKKYCFFLKLYEHIYYRYVDAKIIIIIFENLKYIFGGGCKGSTWTSDLSAGASNRTKHKKIVYLRWPSQHGLRASPAG